MGWGVKGSLGILGAITIQVHFFSQFFKFTLCSVRSWTKEDINVILILRLEPKLINEEISLAALLSALDFELEE